MLLLAAGLAATYQLARTHQEEDAAAATRSFDQRCFQITEKLRLRLGIGEATLRTAAAFLERAGRISQAEWQELARRLQIQRHHPALHEFGFAPAIPREEMAAFVAQTQAESPPQFTLWPGTDRELHAPITLHFSIEPNPKLLGQDLLHDPVHRAALERARDEGRPILCAKTSLVLSPDSGLVTTSTLVAPVYRAGAILDSPSARRQALAGWVFLSCRTAELIHSVLAEGGPTRKTPLLSEVFDGDGTKAAARIFASQPDRAQPAPDSGRLQRTTRLLVAGRPWTLRFAAGEDAATNLAENNSWLITVGGSTCSLLVSGLIFSLLRTRTHARTMALRFTEELRRSEERWQFALEGAGDGVWDWNVQTNEVYFSPRWKAMLGFGNDEIRGTLGEWDQRIHPSDREAVYADLKRHLAGETPAYRNEHRVQAKDGTYRWMLDRGQVVAWTPDGKPLRVIGTHADITPRKQSEEQLQRANLVIEQSSSSIMITNSQGVIEYVNEEFSRTTGYSKLEAIGRNPRFLGAGTTRPEDYQQLWESLLAGRHWSGKFHNRRKDGTTHWEAVAISPLRSAEGQITHFVCMKQDISELTRLHLAQEDNLTNFRTFFESMSDLVFVGRADGKILFTNRAVPKSLGYTPEELAGMHLLDVHPRDRRAEAEQIFAAMFRGDRAACLLPLAAKDGRLVPVETRVWSGKWDGMNCVFGLSKNLTAEQEAQQRFEKLFRHNPSPMALSQPPEMRFFDVNDSFLRTTGYTAAEVLGRTAEELGLFPDASDHAVVAAQLAQHGHLQNLPLKIRRRDGTIVHGLFAGELIQHQGQQFLLAVMNDITEQKRREGEAAAQLEREREISEAKGRFISVASHEFRTPMTAALASVELLQNHFDKIPPSKRAAILGRTRFSLRRMNEILDEVLTLNRLDRQHVEVCLAGVDLVEVVHDLLIEVRLADHQAHAIQLTASPDVIPFVTDPKLFHHLFSNLLSNAIRYSPAGSTIQVQLLRQPEHLEFSVEDEGIGIPAADRARVFGAFERGSNVGSIPGTGLGLNIVKQMTDLLHGSITISDGKLKGTRFTLRFPQLAIPAEPAPTPGCPPPPGDI